MIILTAHEIGWLNCCGHKVTFLLILGADHDPCYRSRVFSAPVWLQLNFHTTPYYTNIPGLEPDLQVSQDNWNYHGSIYLFCYPSTLYPNGRYLCGWETSI